MAQKAAGQTSGKFLVAISRRALQDIANDKVLQDRIKFLVAISRRALQDQPHRHAASTRGDARKTTDSSTRGPEHSCRHADNVPFVLVSEVRTTGIGGHFQRNPPSPCRPVEVFGGRVSLSHGQHAAVAGLAL